MADKPVYTSDLILTQIQTSWGGNDRNYRAWTHPIVTYFIGADRSPPSSGGDEANGFVAMTSDQVAAATLAFQLWGELISGITLVAGTDRIANDISFAYTTKIDDKSSGYAAPALDDPNGNHIRPIDHQSVWISANAGSNQSGALGFESFGFQTYLHEIGHALGLSHPGNYNADDTQSPTYEDDAVFAQDTQQYTIMSYFGSEFADGWHTDDNGGKNPSTPQLYDVLAVQEKYGANFSTRDGDTVYGYHSTAGHDLFDFSRNIAPVFTIWDGGGNDTIDASLYLGKQTIDLEPGSFSSVLGYANDIAVAFDPGGDPTANAALIENAIGGGGDDTLIGNVAANHLVGAGGDDTLRGMSGDDLLEGGSGNDTLDGGNGNNALDGGSGDDTLTGGGDNDILAGGTGNDVLDGSAGADTLDGGDGDDVVDGGGTGNGIYASLTDMVTGGAGADTFLYGAGYHKETITDFTLGEDTLDLTGVTKLHGLDDLLRSARQDGNDLVFDLGNYGSSGDMLRLQNMSLYTFDTISPLDVALTPDRGITITPNPSGNFSTMFVSVAPLAGGGFVATRFSYADVVANNFSAFRYDATGTLIDSTQVNVTPSDAHQVRAIGLGGGKTLVVWFSSDADDGAPALRARLLDDHGTPIGGEFSVNTDHMGPTSQYDFGLQQSSDGTGAIVSWNAPSPIFVSGVQQYHLYQSGVDANGNVVGPPEDKGLSVFSNPVGVPYGIDGFTYYDGVGEDGKLHAYYEMPNSSVPIQLDDGDFYADFGADQAPFQAIALTDGRVMFSYLSGFIVGYSQSVNADRVVIVGGDGGFTKPGTDTDDFLIGGPHGDQLYGKGGDDTLLGLGGGDLLDGGSGNDTAAYSRSPEGVTIDLRIAGAQAGQGDGAGDVLVSIENLVGSAHDDILRGDAGANRIEGGNGNDTIEGNGGADTLIGGAGNDRILLAGTANFDDGVAVAYGGTGNDSIMIDGDNAVAYGEEGDDKIVVAGGNDAVYGGAGDDILTARSGNGNILSGGEGDDAISGGPGDDFLYGDGGDDFYAASPGHDTYDDSGGDRDVLIFTGKLSDYVVAYDAASDTLTITDTRGDAPDGVATVHGIDTFDFTDRASLTLSEVIALAGAPAAAAGKAEDGYLSGATVFADANGNHRLDAGEVSATTDDQGNFTLTGGSGALVATGGTDTATHLAFDGFLAAPAGATVVTPLTTLVELLAEGGAAAPVAQVLQQLGLSAGYDLLHADPLAAAATDPTALAVAKAGAAIVSDVSVIAAALHGQDGVDLAAASATAFAALAGALSGGTAFDLADPATLRAVAAAAGLGAATADRVGDALAHVAGEIAAATDLDGATAAQTEAQGTLAQQVATPLAPAVTLTHDTGASATDAVTADAALTVTPSEPGGTLAYAVDGVAVATYDPTTLGQGSHSVAVTQTNAGGATSAAATVRFTYDSVAPDLAFTAPGSAVAPDATVHLSGSVGGIDAGRTVTVAEGSAVIGTAVAASDGSWSLDTSFHTAATHALTASVSDLAGNTAQAAASVAVVRPNHVPVAAADTATVQQDRSLTIAAATLLANDSDPDGDTLAVTGVGEATHGSVAYDAASGTITFTADAGYHGAASFRYTVADPTGATATADVAVSVVASTPGGGVGDVHYVTFDGLRYDLQITGDYLVTRALAGTPLEIEGHAEGTSRGVSYLTAIAITTDRHRIVFDDAHPGQLLIDGRVATIAAGGHLDLGGGVLVDRSGDTYTLSTGDDRIWWDDHKRFIDLWVDPGLSHGRNSFEGLLGNLDGKAANDLVLHDGTVFSHTRTDILEGTYAADWQLAGAGHAIDLIATGPLAERALMSWPTL